MINRPDEDSVLTPITDPDELAQLRDELTALGIPLPPAPAPAPPPITPV